MNTDIRISVSFMGHRKRRKLRLVLGENSTDYLIDLWISTAMSHPTGRLNGMDEIDIALAAGWDKDSALFVAGLMRCGFLDRHEDGTYALHDWEEHQGYAVHAEARSAKSKKAAETRWKARNDAPSIEKHATSNAPSTISNAPIPAPIPAPVPAPVPVPSPKEEKAKSKAKECAPAQSTPLPADFTITPELQSWANEKGYGDLNAHLDPFKDKAQAKGYQYTDWNAAFRNAVRDDWAGLRKPAIAAPAPLNGARYASSQAMTPEGSKFDAILRNMNTPNLQSVIEGECSHATC